MEMEVVVRVPLAGGDMFNFGSPCSSHYFSAPSTPFSSLSAPTTPSSLAFNFFRLDDVDLPIGSPSAVPFRWEEKPGIPKSPNCSADQDFEFHCTHHSTFFPKPSLCADELFHAGKIKPLKPPPGFQSNVSSRRSPHNHNPRLSPRKTKSNIHMNINDNPFEAALIKETLSHRNNYELVDSHNDRNKGRSDKNSYISSNFARKQTRSLSPFRISSETALHGDDDNSLAGADTGKSKFSFLSAISFSKPSRKWRLRDLLFRSASEGRAMEKADKLRSTHSVMSEKLDDDRTISSFRSADGGGPRMRFTAGNRAVSEELTKKKSFLLNKPGFLGRCLRFNRSGMQEISRGIGLTRG